MKKVDTTSEVKQPSEGCDAHRKPCQGIDLADRL